MRHPLGRLDHPRSQRGRTPPSRLEKQHREVRRGTGERGRGYEEEGGVKLYFFIAAQIAKVAGQCNSNWPGNFGNLGSNKEIQSECMKIQKELRRGWIGKLRQGEKAMRIQVAWIGNKQGEHEWLGMTGKEEQDKAGGKKGVEGERMRRN